MLRQLEQEFGFVFPDAHRQAMQDEADTIHEACDFLVPESPHELLRFGDVNRFLHADSRPGPWPRYLVAFASNGCGDYFAYDTRWPKYRIHYMDPYCEPAENLSATAGLSFASFEEWHAETCTRWKRRRH